jgi:hypothetical protein
LKEALREIAQRLVLFPGPTIAERTARLNLRGKMAELTYPTAKSDRVALIRKSHDGMKIPFAH